MQINYLPLLLSGTLLCSGQTTAIADPTLDSTGSPAYLKILAQPAEPWSKISEKQRFDLYASLNFSPYAGLSSMASAAISQAIDSPHEWGEGWGPYGVRIASIPQLRVHQILDTTLVSGIDRGQSRRLQRHQRLTGFISCAFRQGEIGPTAHFLSEYHHVAPDLVRTKRSRRGNYVVVAGDFEKSHKNNDHGKHEEGGRGHGKGHDR